MMLVDAIRSYAKPSEFRQILRKPSIRQAKQEASAGRPSKRKIEAMAADAMKSGNIAVNPRSSRQCDIEMLYHKAL